MLEAEAALFGDIEVLPEINLDAMSDVMRAADAAMAEGSYTRDAFDEDMRKIRKITTDADYFDEFERDAEAYFRARVEKRIASVCASLAEVTMLTRLGEATGLDDKALAASPAASIAKEYDESEHPRDDSGRWTSGAGVSRDDLPGHIRAVVPPSYTVVRFNADPDASCIAVIEDAKGREKRLYSDEHSARQAAAKFARIDEMQGKFDSIMRQNAGLMGSSDDRVRQNAECFHVVATTGLRPGSERDTKADRQAYGATTLRREHVVVDGDEVRLRFVGKNGKDLDIPVHDPKAAEILRTRAAAAGEGGRIFPAVSDRSLLDHTHGMDGGGFKTKDLRTHLGTHIAAETVRSMSEPKTESERKKAIRQVGDTVARRLGNTRTVALQAYISPSVFDRWRKK